jgi:hypothetical protein
MPARHRPLAPRARAVSATSTSGNSCAADFFSFVQSAAPCWPIKDQKNQDRYYRTYWADPFDFSAGPTKVKKSRRRVVVFTSLIAVLTFTSALLLALAPAPLSPDAASSLFAVDQTDSMEPIFQTEVVPQPGRWKYIYIHHSRTFGGNAITLGQETGGLNDHFVIGNGEGAIDGEIQIGQRWNRQVPANPPAGATGIDPTCISICLIGDFDRNVPTPTQIKRLTQLTSALQSRYGIATDRVLVVSRPNSPAGSGRYFPLTALREQLIR